ncbi:MAG: hypothetical protein ACJA0U_001458 [Salibacteraceae bacterium]|jgi:hypothetical protein
MSKEQKFSLKTLAETDLVIGVKFTFLINFLAISDSISVDFKGGQQNRGLVIINVIVFNRPD